MTTRQRVVHPENYRPLLPKIADQLITVLASIDRGQGRETELTRVDDRARDEQR